MSNNTTAFDLATKQIQVKPRRWLVTGVAGFIGSHLLEYLLSNGQTVVGVDNFATGHPHNLDLVHGNVGDETWKRFQFVEADVSNAKACSDLFQSSFDHVLHQAALGSVPRSIADPLATNLANVTGFLNMLWAAEAGGVTSFVYAASSSTYGDHPALPKVEDQIGKPLSPYAVTKYVNELYADVFTKCYRVQPVGLRYFNVFGPRQDPNGAYAAVIPRWIQAMLRNGTVKIFGDGETSRDFCYVNNVVQANVLAALNSDDVAGEVFNVAVGGRTSLNQLVELIRESLLDQGVTFEPKSEHVGFRDGDVRHSQADISKAIDRLGYQPTHDVRQGIRQTTSWFVVDAKAGMQS